MALAVTPTVFPLPYHLFNPAQDAKIIHESIEDIGVNGETLVNILTQRSLNQRLQIARKYKMMYKSVLTMTLALQIFLFDDVLDIFQALLQTLPNYYAEELYQAMDGLGTDEDTLISIIAILTNHEKALVQRAYAKRYGESLIETITRDTSGPFQTLLIGLLQANRSESYTVDRSLAEEQARILANFTTRYDKDHRIYLFSIVMWESFPHIATVAEFYHRLIGERIQEFIWQEFTGDAMVAMWTLMNIAILGKPGFFAKRLHRSMQGLGTDDKQLTRIIVTRSEIDLGTISSIFYQKYKENLSDYIKDDTSGYYQQALLSLIGTPKY